MSEASNMLLSIQDLRVAFRIGKEAGVMQRFEAVGRGNNGVSFDVPEPDSPTSATVAATCWPRHWPRCRNCAARKSPACSRTR
jgi:hypothetical protein